MRKILFTNLNSFSSENLFKILQNIISHTRFYTVVAMMFVASASQGQSLKTWKEDLTSIMEKFLKCAATGSNNTTCTSFIEESIASVYKLDASDVEASIGKSSVSGISNSKGSQWSIVGMAFDQKALESAQRYANENKAVIAVYQPSGEVIKHVALILPGDLQYSGSWGYKVPNSASFFITTPDKSYMDKGLSYAFAKSMLLRVTLYVRNK